MTSPTLAELRAMQIMRDGKEAVELQTLLTDRYPQYRQPDGGLFAWARAALIGKPMEWADYERIADNPDVNDALQGFSEDPTGDNGTCVVRAVMEAAK